MRRDKKHEEKERLMKEVLGKSRPYEDEQTSENISLSFGTKQVKTSDTLKYANQSFDSLKEILSKQQKDLEKMNREINTPKSFNTQDMSQVQKELQQDYGVKVQPEKAQKIDHAKIFQDVLEELRKQLVVEDSTLEALNRALRRPFVMGETKGRAKNVVVITGPSGSGKHAAIASVAKSLYHRQIFLSEDVYTIDMSLYQSGSQEQIFLQDLYQALNGKGGIICFENFSASFPSFLRMLDELVCDGKITLNKRYVLNQGILVENQTGLVKDAIDSLSSEGKYLFFVSDDGMKSIQDSFGADFMYHVLDTVEFHAFNETQIKEIIETSLKELIDKTTMHLGLTIENGEILKQWVFEHYDKNQGADSVMAIFNDFYISLSQAALNNSSGSNCSAVIEMKEEKPVVKLGENEISLLRSKTSEEEIEAVNKEMDEIVGLRPVKEYVRSLQSHIQIQNLRREQGLKTSSVSKHMIFTGNPGTGKTTIARLLSRYMKAIGALSKGQLVEVTRGDLVAQYVGQTAPLTMNVIKSAIGGVLFIDEAYSLYRGKDDAFGLESIDTIVKAMEDNRDDLIVVLAGYKKEMSAFLESNSGLKSRFPNIIDFPDYTGEELCAIATIQAKNKGYFIQEDAYPKLQEYFNHVQATNAAEAGNGRLARNVIEEAILKQSSRLVKNPNSKLDELLLEDFDLS